MNIICDNCDTFHWIDERIAGSTAQNPKFEICCKKGDIRLPDIKPPPDRLCQLYESDESYAKDFWEQIRQYNASLTFTSLRYVADERIGNRHGGPTCFQIHGKLYHIQGPLQEENDNIPRYTQLFFYDPTYAAQVRSQQNPQLNQQLLHDLTMILHDINPFIKYYRTAREQLQDATTENNNIRIILNPQMRLIIESTSDQCYYNLPTSNECYG
jgi:hypothetical protein